MPKRKKKQPLKGTRTTPRKPARKAAKKTVARRKPSTDGKPKVQVSLRLTGRTSRTINTVVKQQRRMARDAGVPQNEVTQKITAASVMRDAIVESAETYDDRATPTTAALMMAY